MFAISLGGGKVLSYSCFVQIYVDLKETDPIQKFVLKSSISTLIKNLTAHTFHLLHSLCWSSATASLVGGSVSQPSLGVKLLSSLYVSSSPDKLHYHLLLWPWTVTKAH